MNFPTRIEIPIRNHLTGKTCRMIRAADLPVDGATLAQIVEVCNEPEIYRWLFAELCGGQPYGVEQARSWLEWSRAGWLKGTHFVFVVTDAHGRLAAACDLKMADPVAEVGYWCSAAHRGLMTNTVTALIALAAGAGFTGLFARTRNGNQRSMAVLERAGFTPRGLQPDGMYHYERPLVMNTRGDDSGRMSRKA